MVVEVQILLELNTNSIPTMWLVFVSYPHSFGWSRWYILVGITFLAMVSVSHFCLAYFFKLVGTFFEDFTGLFF